MSLRYVNSNACLLRPPTTNLVLDNSGEGVAVVQVTETQAGSVQNDNIGEGVGQVREIPV